MKVDGVVVNRANGETNFGDKQYCDWDMNCKVIIIMHHGSDTGFSSRTPPIWGISPAKFTPGLSRRGSQHL
jgi:hypothetical protein